MSEEIKLSDKLSELAQEIQDDHWVDNDVNGGYVASPGNGYLELLWPYVEEVESLQQENKRLREELEESVKILEHYANSDIHPIDLHVLTSMFLLKKKRQ